MISLRISALATLLIVTPLSSLLSAQDTTVAGNWFGTLQTDRATYRVQLHLQTTGGAWTCTADSLDQKVFGIPCANVQVSGNSLSYALPSLRASYVGTLSADGATLTGTFTQGKATPLVMQRQSGAVIAAAPQDHDFKTEFLLKLTSKFTPTRFTADRTDIVKVGSVITLQKEPLLLFATTEALPPTNVYKNGKLSLGGWTALDASNKGDDRTPQRTFVESEKFWLTGATFNDDGFFLTVVSDPFNDVRYYGKIKFPFNKKNPPTSDELMKLVSEVITTDDAGPASASAAQPAPPPQQAAPAALAPIAPPPPPVDAPPAEPKTIAIGQTREVVVAILGQPQKVVKLPTKEIDIYPDMKIIFVKDKVSDVQ